MIAIKIRKPLLCAVAVMLTLCALLTSHSVTAAHAANVTSKPQTITQDLTSVSVMAAGATEKAYVYDENENKLMYNRVTGMVFTSAGVVYNQDSQPLTYDDKTEQFEDSLQRRMDLVERSTGGLQNYYLMFGGYKVRSIGINDTLYIAKIKANTDFNSGATYDMLVTRVWVSYSLFSSKWALVLTGHYGEYEYYDLRGHKIDFKYFDVKTKPNLMAGAGTSWAGGFVGFEKWGTILDLLDEIVILMELVPPTGSPMGEFALNTVTGGYLRDDRGQKIRILDTGQLIDPMGWALIGADARPLWWREDIRAYTNHKGELLTYTNEENILTDKNGFIAHSVITNVIAGLRIYIVYLADGKTLIPVTLKTISINPYQADYYDMNGNKIDLNELTEPEISVDDRKENYPEEFLSGWDKFIAFIKKWWWLLLIGLIFLVTLPFTLPILTTIFQFLIKGLIALFKGLFKLIALPFKKLFKRDKNP